MEEGAGPSGQRRLSNRVRSREEAQLDEQLGADTERVPGRRRCGALACGHMPGSGGYM